MVALPDFLLIGAPKAGTTALHVALAQHPALHMSTNKEPKYFLTDGLPPVGPGDLKTYKASVRTRPEYEALFANAPEGSLLGESTTLYLRDRGAHLRIREEIPAAKLVAVLRDPVDRAHSNWTHLRSAGLEPEGDFVKACGLERERVARGWAPFWRYLELGRYGAQLEHVFTVFPREQVLVLRYREVRERPIETLNRVCAFLGVQTGLLNELPAENVTAQVSGSRMNAALQRVTRSVASAGHRLPAAVGDKVTSKATKVLQREQRTRQPLTPEERAVLLPTFDDDVTLLEHVTGESFSDWRDASNSVSRSPLAVTRKFGTGFSSIDRPLAG
jgi:hypothetical protein